MPAEEGPKNVSQGQHANLLESVAEGYSYDERKAAFRRPDTIRFQRKRADMNPISWRRNRKKMTELTSITTLKQPGASQDQPHVSTSQSTLGWLAERFSSLAGEQPTMSSSMGADAGEARLNSLGLPKYRTGTISAADVVTAKQRRRQRRRARGNDSLCLELQKQHDVVP